MGTTARPAPDPALRAALGTAPRTAAPPATARPAPMTVPGLILAGGLATRMGGGDKGMLPVGGIPILARTVATLRPQLAALALSANGDPARFAALGLPVLPDADGGGAGPLAGILAGLRWAAAAGYGALVTAPGDCPFLPPDLVARLRAAAVDGHARAASGGRTHPVAALWPVAAIPAIAAALATGRRRVEAAAPRCGLATWSTDPLDPFTNVNTPTDLARADSLCPTP